MEAAQSMPLRDHLTNTRNYFYSFHLSDMQLFLWIDFLVTHTHTHAHTVCTNRALAVVNCRFTCVVGMVHYGTVVIDCGSCFTERRSLIIIF